MVALSRLLNVAGSALLLVDVPALWNSTNRRGRGLLRRQLQLTLLLLLLRHAASLPSVWKRIENLAIVKAWSRISESSAGALATGAVVPVLLAMTGLPLAAGKGGQRQRMWFLRVLCVGSAPVLADAIEERFGEEVDSIAVLAFELGLLTGENAAAAVILLMLSGGEALEHYAFATARHGLKHVLSEDPPVAHRLRHPDQVDSMDIEDLDAVEVQCGDVLVVRAGEVVPVDGRLLGLGKGEVAIVDEGLLTGETNGTTKTFDDTIMSGSVAHQPIRISVTTPFAGSTLELMRQALQDALERKGALQQKSARAATLLKPLTLAVAAFALTVRRHRKTPQRRWQVVLSVLMAATPCPALIGVPVAFLSGMSVAARQGVLIKSGAAIEALAAATHIVLDKTGTLTRGEPVVKFFEVVGHQVGDAGWRDALQLVGSIELLSTHPLASAVRRFAESHGVDFLSSEESENVYGCGVRGSIGGRRVVVGTPMFLESHANTREEYAMGRKQTADEYLEAHFIIMSESSEIRGRVLLEDPVREGTSRAVEKLRQLGLKVSVLSGDRSPHLRDVCNQVGIDDARGGCLPLEKAQAVQKLCEHGTVIMVGDEGNDAPALAAAHVGISLGASGLASQSADVVIAAHPSAGSLERVAHLVALSRTVVATAGRGVRCGMGVSALQVAFAGTGRIPPRTNAILQELVDFSALVNAASVLRHRSRWEKLC